MLHLKLVALLIAVVVVNNAAAQGWQPIVTSDNSIVVAAHEVGSVVHGDKLYVMGGRGERPVQVYDTTLNQWSTLAPLPIELHHFQPVVHNGGIYVIGAFTCCYPNEINVSDIYRLDIALNKWEIVGEIPAERLRGATAAVSHNDKIYLIGGNNKGHSGGAVAWMDEYNPASNSWNTLSDAPLARDHFTAAVIGNRLIVTGGRQTNLSFAGTIAETNIYDFSTGSWTTATSIPTPRAGTVVAASKGNLIVIGGESDIQTEAHKEVEAFHIATNQWRSLPSLETGRHGGAVGVVDNTLHAITGNTYQGGGQETDSHEALHIPDSDNNGIFDFEEDIQTNPDLDNDNDGLTNIQEQELGTDPRKKDTDGDGLDDNLEVNQYSSDPLKQDTDNDGLIDSTEVNQHLTDPNKPDTDEDGIEDGLEVNQHNTNPRDVDSDGDGLSDFEEIDKHNSNPISKDTDSDGLDDKDEIEYSTNPRMDDTDQDGLSDYDELILYKTDPLNTDSDSDGYSDGQEIQNGNNPTDFDQDKDGILNSTEGTIDSDNDGIPNLLDIDSDNDGITDNLENGHTQNSQESPTSILLDTDNDSVPNIYDLDSDQDGITDLTEAGILDVRADGRISTAIFVDADNDGMNDSISTNLPPDTDGDLIPNFLDLDSDSDNIADVIEGGQPDNDMDGQLDSFVDEDRDGLHDPISGMARKYKDTDEDGKYDVLDNTSDPIKTQNGGCTLVTSDAKVFDPTILLSFLFFLVLRIYRARVNLLV